MRTTNILLTLLCSTSFAAVAQNALGNGSRAANNVAPMTNSSPTTCTAPTLNNTGNVAPNAQDIRTPTIDNSGNTSATNYGNNWGNSTNADQQSSQNNNQPSDQPTNQPMRDGRQSSAPQINYTPANVNSTNH